MGNLKVTLSGWELDNPIIASSGTFGYGSLYQDIYDINLLGSFSLKGTTAEERFGNPMPRSAECSYGILSSVGLQNPGVDFVLNTELPKLARHFQKKVFANICGSSIDEYVLVASRFDSSDQVGILELNLSCPNVRVGGMGFGTTPDMAAAVTKSVRAATTKPLYVKLSSNAADLTAIACACEQAGADGLCMVNTMPGIKIDLRSRKPVLGNVIGGYSSPAMLPISERMVYEAYKAVHIPIIGVGGIEKAEDVLEMMMAGATAVEIGSANLLDPGICRDILAALPAVMDKYGIRDINEIIGAAHRA